MVLELGDWGTLLLVISYIFGAVSLIVCVYATYAGFVDYAKKKASGMEAAPLKTQQLTMVITIFCMWMFLAINLCDVIGLPNWLKQKEAAIPDETGWGDWEGWWDWWEPSAASYLSWNVFWAVAKANLYLVYLYRIYGVSKELKYETKSVIYYITLFLLLAQFVCMILWVYYYNATYYFDRVWEDNQYETCTTITWVILILDIIVSVLLFYLYITCMSKLFTSLPAEALQMENVNVAGITGSNAGTAQTDAQVMTADDAITDDENDETNAGGAGDENVSKGAQAWDATQNELIRTATRLFVVFMISFVSSLFYQLMFGIAITEEFYGTHAHTALYYFTFTWNVDSTLNVICLWLSLPIGKKMYYALCKCDGCCFRCIQKMTKN